MAHEQLKRIVAEEIAKSPALGAWMRSELTRAALEEAKARQGWTAPIWTVKASNGTEYSAECGDVTRDDMNALSYRLGDIPTRVGSDGCPDGSWSTLIVTWPQTP